MSTINETRLALTLKDIFHAGDRDECSIKHIGHSLAAIHAGKTWRDGVDYPYPWDTYLHKHTVDWLDVQWLRIETIRDEVGADEFAEMLDRIPTAQMYWRTYAERHWGLTSR